MSITAKVLAGAQFIDSAGTTLYTCPTGTRAIIDKCSMTNTDASARTITINIIPSGSSIATSNAVTSALSIAANTAVDMAEMKNQILAAGDQIVATSSLAGKIVGRLSGREIA